MSIPNAKEVVDPTSMFSVVDRCFQVMSERLQVEWRKHSHVVIEPDVADIGWDSFVSAQRLVEMGEKAALAALPAIREWLEGGEAGIARASTGTGSRAIVPQTA